MGGSAMEKHHKQLLDSLATGLLAVDLENRVLFLNRTLARSLGIQVAEWVGRPVTELAGIIEARVASPEFFRSRLDWRTDPEATASREVEYRQGEQILHLREDARPLRDSAGRVIGRLFAYQDISREKQIDRMKSEFISVASHELRTPMTSIKGSVDLILSGFAGDVSPETQELLEIAQKGCDRLIRLINDILDLSKIEAGQMKLHLVSMDIGEVVTRSILGVRQLADEKKVRLRVELPEALPEVELDKDRMEQVLTNLLSNAIKFSPPEGEVCIELANEDAWVRCAVIDQGCGIAEEDLPKVFGKFKQVGESARKKSGTGLGLAITQALVHEHGGKIWVESRPNEGSRFVFQLPSASPAANH